jgi:uncharacterized protein (DUF58 family)
VTSPLLDAAFLQRLEALRRQLVSEARSGRVGEGVAPRRGSGSEFREHRPYVTGDDPRRVDWMATARLGEPVVKLYLSEEDRVVRLLLDASASLGFGNPTKLDVGRRLAGAFAYLALANSERAQVFVGRETAADAGLSHAGTALRGRRAFPRVCRELEAVTPSGKTNLARALEEVLTRAARPGLLVVLSDFFDRGSCLSALARARSQGHDLILVQILDSEEVEPRLDGDYALEDSETGESVELTLDVDAHRAYRARLEQLLESLRAAARKHHAAYVRVIGGNDLEGAIRRALSGTID